MRAQGCLCNFLRQPFLEQFASYREESLFLGMGSFSVALVALAIGKVALGCFFAVAAALALGFAAWSFLERERVIARDLGWANARLVNHLQKARGQLNEERRTASLLESKEARLTETIVAKGKEIATLKALLDERGQEIEKWGERYAFLQGENARLRGIGDRLKTMMK